jgi:hypothetical protein
MEVSFKDYKKIFDEEKYLIRDGIILPESNADSSIPDYQCDINFKKERDLFLSDFKEFEICCEWLSKFKKVKNQQIDSEYLKYAICALQPVYVTNGAVIAAAIYLNLSRSNLPDEKGSIKIGISLRCPVLKQAKRFATLF